MLGTAWSCTYGLISSNCSGISGTIGQDSGILQETPLRGTCRNFSTYYWRKNAENEQVMKKLINFV